MDVDDITAALPKGTPQWIVTIVLTLVGLNYVFKMEATKTIWTGVKSGVKWIISQRARQEAREVKLLALKTKERDNDTLEAYRELRHEFRSVLKTSGASRVSAVQFTNGGGDVADKSGDKFLTVFLAVEENLSADLEADLKKVPIGVSYRNEVLEPLVKAKGQAHVCEVFGFDNTNEMKSILLADGISSVALARATIEFEVVWYVALHFKDMIPVGEDLYIARARAEFQTERAARVLERLLPRLGDTNIGHGVTKKENSND